MKVGDRRGQLFDRVPCKHVRSLRASIIYVGAFLVACGSSSPGGNRDNGTDGGNGGSNGSGGSDGGGGASLGSCAIFPSDFIFNTQIAALPADPSSSSYISTIGAGKLHLDLGTELDS